MRGLFLYDHPIDPQFATGVEKKVLNQITALNKAGLNCQLHPLRVDLPVSSRGNIVDLIRKRMPFSNQGPRWEYDTAYNDIDYLYFRKPSFITVHLRRMLRELKTRNTRVKILMEIPTYPYDAEYKPLWREFPFLWKDRYNRTRLQGLVSKTVLISQAEYQEVFGIPVIRIINGIDVAAVSHRHPCPNNVIDLVAVAKFAAWHGYERLLQGLAQYYAHGGSRNIIVHLVGQGMALNGYKSISMQPLLKDRVKFYGHQSGKALEDIYDIADIGVCSLGLFQKGLEQTSELKSREYLAKGLPIITGCVIDILAGQNPPFVCAFPNDPSTIDIQRVIDFYDDIYGEDSRSLPLVLEQTRDFVARRADIQVTMAPVINYLHRQGGIQPMVAGQDVAS